MLQVVSLGINNVLSLSFPLYKKKKRTQTFIYVKFCMFLFSIYRMMYDIFNLIEPQTHFTVTYKDHFFSFSFRVLGEWSHMQLLLQY